MTDRSVIKRKIKESVRMTIPPVLAESRRRKEARPAELMTSALALFVEKGFAATRLDDVARRAGVSKGTVYLYFSSKDDLFKAVIREGIMPLLGEVQDMVTQHNGDSGSLLREILYAWWRMIGGTELAGVPKLMISEAQNFPEVAQFYFDNVIVPGRALVANVLERGMVSGEFRRLPVESAVDVIFSPLMMMVIWRFSIGVCCRQTPPNPYQFIDQHLDIVLHGLRTAFNSSAASVDAT